MANTHISKYFIQTVEQRVDKIVNDERPNSDYTTLHLSMQDAVKAALDAFGFSDNEAKTKMHYFIQNLAETIIINRNP